jgi:putative FmdB family regulatory protein
MPIYEYACSDCGHREERFEHLSAACEDQACGNCGASASLRRVLSLPAPCRFGGSDGKLRTGEKLKARNEAYHKSAKGQEEHRAGIAAARARGLPA